MKRRTVSQSLTEPEKEYIKYFIYIFIHTLKYCLLRQKISTILIWMYNLFENYKNEIKNSNLYIKLFINIEEFEIK